MVMRTIGRDKNLVAWLLHGFDTLRKITSFFSFSVFVLLFSCSKEELPTGAVFDKDIHCCKAFMNVLSEKYSDELLGITRAAVEAWNDGTTIYVTLQGNSTKCEGEVVYNQEDGGWTLYYDGILPNGDYSGIAYYIKGVYQTNCDVISFGAENPVYIDTDITCQRKNEGVWISVMLQPQTGRIRFTGVADKDIKVSGVWSYSAFDVTNKSLSESQSPIELQIGADGYTPYCYCSFPQASRTLSVAYDNYLFTTICEHPILDAAQAGYMELPTEVQHSGWEMSVISLPSVSDVSVSGIGTNSATFSSSIIDNGNATISECGFCYSTTVNPTIDDVRISYGSPTGNSFAKNITGLKENTTYHVRAYAINELGIAYSQDKQFTTVAITLPTLSTVTVNGKEGEGRADFSAVITSDGDGSVGECGFVYSTHDMPSITDSKLLSSSKPNLSSSVSNLTVGTRYYVRAFATNEKGTAYGQQVSFIAGGGKPGDDDIDRPIL